MTIKKRKPGTHSIADTWENRKVARVVSLAAAGRSSIAIAEELRDGTSAAAIRSMLHKWSVETTGEPFCKVPLSTRTRAWLLWRAERRGLTPEQYLAKVVDKVIRDDLFKAIVEDD